MLSGMLGAVVLALCTYGSARAADDEAPSIWNLDKRVYRNFMYGLGFRDSTEQAMEYRERSPLVVPPTRNLPAPQSGAAARNPAWPKDPDGARKETKRAKPLLDAGDSRDPIEKFGRVLTPSELNRNVPAPKRTTQTGAGVDDSYAPVAPSELGYMGGAWNFMKSGFGLWTPEEEVGSFTQEPPRASLTAPPTGYMTPSPAQPYGFVKRPEYQKPLKTEDLAVGKPGTGG